MTKIPFFVILRRVYTTWSLKSPPSPPSNGPSDVDLESNFTLIKPLTCNIFQKNVIQLTALRINEVGYVVFQSHLYHAFPPPVQALTSVGCQMYFWLTGRCHDARVFIFATSRSYISQEISRNICPLLQSARRIFDRFADSWIFVGNVQRLTVGGLILA